MRRGLPKSELQRLEDFYDDYGLWQGFLKERELGAEDPDHPANQMNDWEADRVRGGPVTG